MRLVRFQSFLRFSRMYPDKRHLRYPYHHTERNAHRAKIVR